MFKNFKKNDKYFTIALYAFVVIALLIALIFAFINLGKINLAIKGFFGAISAFIYGFVIAYICHPLYEKLHKYVFKFVEKGKPRPKLRKILSLLLTYIIFFSIITILLFAIMPSIMESINGLLSNITAENITKWFDSIIQWLKGYFPDLDSEKVLDTIYSFIFDENGSLTLDIPSILGVTTNFVFAFAKALIDQVFAIIVGIILSVYFLIHAENIGARLKKGLCAIFKKENYEKIIEFAKYTDKTFGRYLIGTICDSMIVGLVVGILLAIFDITDYAVLIGVIVGCTNVIPFFGPFIGAIPSALIILISSGPLDEAIWKVLAFVVLIIVVQQLDGNVFAPHIIGASIGLTPIGVIAAVTICSHFFGFLGMLIGVPLSAVLTYFFTNMINKKLKKKNLPSDTDLYSKPDIFNNEEFIKASFDVEAQSRIETKEAVEKAKEDLELHQIGIHEAQERIINEKEQVVIDAESSPDEAYSTAEVPVPDTAENPDESDDGDKK